MTFNPKYLLKKNNNLVGFFHKMLFDSEIMNSTSEMSKNV